MQNIVSEVTLNYKSKIKSSERVQIRDSKSSAEVFRSIDHYNDNMELYECFYCMYLSKANKVLSVMMISEGGTSGTVMDVKKVIAPAILQNASSVIVSHNHPSGNLQPSGADKLITEKLKNACKFMDITVLDHIILTSEGYYSFADKSIL